MAPPCVTHAHTPPPLHKERAHKFMTVIMGVPCDPLIRLENGTRIVEVGHTCQAGLDTPFKPHPGLVARTSLIRHNDVYRLSTAGLGVLTQSEKKGADLRG